MDLVSWTIPHPARLSDEEIIHQLYCFVGAGTIGHHPHRRVDRLGSAALLADDEDKYEYEYTRALSGGTVTIRRAVDEVLWT
ncbi:hypothetical protein [Streptomyces sp. NBC_01506]|uniref:hypothetical protein n=1 Tax=Streptomyces sp. NBC_01506 TaxID=2903887 RepID=UPI003865F04A